MKENKKKFDFNIIVVLFPLLVLLSKFIRYTFMNDVLVTVGIGNSWIPFFSSAYTIPQILSETIAGEQNGTAILFFKYFNFFNCKSYGDFEIVISLIFNFLLIIMFLRCKKNINLWELIFVSSSIAVLNIFCFCLSKEPLQMIFFIIIYYILLSDKIKHKEILSMITILISAIIFRKYYFLIVAFSILVKLIITYLFNDKINKKKVLLTLIITSLSYIALLLFCKAFLDEYYLELIRVRSRISEATTDIRNIFGTSENLFLLGINYLVTILRLLFPIELLLMGPKYILYIVYQFIITISVIYVMMNFKKTGSNQRIAIYIYLGFLLTSATFEPDFGSWIRHEAILFPIFLIINNIAHNKKKFKNEINFKKGVKI